VLCLGVVAENRGEGVACLIDHRHCCRRAAFQAYSMKKVPMWQKLIKCLADCNPQSSLNTFPLGDRCNPITVRPYPLQGVILCVFQGVTPWRCARLPPPAKPCLV
jgi:hypothetical protein